MARTETITITLTEQSDRPGYVAPEPEHEPFSSPTNVAHFLRREGYTADMLHGTTFTRRVRAIDYQVTLDSPELAAQVADELAPVARLAHEMQAVQDAAEHDPIELLELIGDIENARQNRQAAEWVLDTARRDHDDLIRTALERGCPVSAIAAAARLSPARIYQIRDSRR